jgi:hypothetical protein
MPRRAMRRKARASMGEGVIAVAGIAYEQDERGSLRCGFRMGGEVAAT